MQSEISNTNRITKIQLTIDGQLLLTGNSEPSIGATGSDIFAIKLDLLFNELWTFTLARNFNDFTESSLQTIDGNIYIVGYGSNTGDGNSDRDAIIIKLNAQGIQQWSKISDFVGSDYYHNILELPDGNLVVNGTTILTGSTNQLVVKYGTNGSQIKSTTFGGTGNESSYSMLKLNNSIYLSGNTWSSGAGQADITLVQLDFALNIQFAKTYGGTRVESGLSIGYLSKSNELLITGTTDSKNSTSDLFLLKVKLDGTYVSTKLINGTNTEFFNGLNGLLILPNDEVILTFCSNSFTSGSDDLVLLKNLELTFSCCPIMESFIFNTADVNFSSSIPIFNNTDAGTGQHLTIIIVNADLTPIITCVEGNESATISITKNTYCKNESVEFNPINSSVPLKYNWNFDDPSSSDNTSTLPNPNHTFTTSGNFVVQLITNFDCNSDTDTVHIFIKPSIPIANSIIVIEGCKDLPFTFSSTNPSLNLTYYWEVDDFTGLATRTTDEFEYIFHTAGVYQVRLSISDNNCNEGFDTVDVTVFPFENANYNYNIDPCNNSINFQNLSNTDSVFWDFGDGSNSSASMVNHQYLANGSYNVTLTTNPGTVCEGSISQLITFTLNDQLNSLLIPNVFSPNGDGINDKFEISLSQGACLIQSLTIYNRWGEKIYTTTSPNISWDGKIEGKILGAGVYLYYLEGIDFKKTGTLSLVY